MVTVLERGLVSENVKWKDVVNNHQAYSQAHLKTPKFEGGPVLGYVTPVSCMWGVSRHSWHGLVVPSVDLPLA